MSATKTDKTTNTNASMTAIDSALANLRSAIANAIAGGTTAPSPSGSWTADTIVVADDGNYYEVQRSEWMKTKITDAASIGVFRPLEEHGVYLASVPTITGGEGCECVVVNMGKILRNEET
jgi:hypothetical protein